jgi:hypothetical protein
MASANQEPIPLSPANARLNFEADLPVVLRGRSLEELGWIRLDHLTLVIPLVGQADGLTPEFYFLRLNFGYYRDWPPSAIFVNPRTKEFKESEDKIWLPRIEGCPEIHVHANYENKGQLICCSATLEFYKVRHGVKEMHIWDSTSQNFAATIHAVQRAIQSSFYKGRQS